MCWYLGSSSIDDSLNELESKKFFVELKTNDCKSLASQLHQSACVLELRDSSTCPVVQHQSSLLSCIIDR